MIVCSIEDFRKICNLTDTANILVGNYWMIVRSGKSYTVHADYVGKTFVVARITKQESLKGMIVGYLKLQRCPRCKKMGLINFEDLKHVTGDFFIDLGMVIESHMLCTKCGAKLE